MLKYTKLLFASLTVLGAAFVALFFMLFYWQNTWSIEILPFQKSLSMSQLGFLMMFSLIGGTGFLTVGLSGIILQFVKNRKRILLTVLTAVLVPILVFSCLFTLDNFIESSNIDFLPPEKIAITNVSLDSTNPLTFSVKAKSFYRYDICFSSAVVEDSNLTAVASINSEWVYAKDSSGQTYSTMKFIYVLPPGAEQILTFNFNTTLPAGNYIFMLCSDRSGRLVFTNFSIS
jgi:hypothetical protein